MYRLLQGSACLGKRQKQTYPVAWASRPYFDGRDARATRWLRKNFDCLSLKNATISLANDASADYSQHAACARDQQQKPSLTQRVKYLSTQETQFNRRELDRYPSFRPRVPPSQAESQQPRRISQARRALPSLRRHSHSRPLPCLRNRPIRIQPYQQ